MNMRPILYLHVLLNSFKLTFFLKRTRMLSATKPRSHPRLPKPILWILTIYGNISEGNNFPKQYHALNRFPNRLIGATYVIFSTKSIMIAAIQRHS